ncbi:MAG: hypothetical protein ACRDRP_22700 [Pseudonocardiaceae bacterium]
MPATYDPWRDTDGVHVAVGCRAGQIAVAKEHGALASRLHQQGRVTGQGGSRLRIQFDGEGTVASVRPHLVRVLTAPGDRDLAPSEGNQLMSERDTTPPHPGEEASHG